MAVVVYKDWFSSFEKLIDEEAEKLIKHFFRYINDINPIAPDRMTELLFEPIKQQLKRDYVKYQETIVKLSDAGKKSAELRRLKEIQGRLIEVQAGATVKVKDKDKVKDKVSSNTTVLKESENFKHLPEPDF